jgi:hypothetical protein
MHPSTPPNDSVTQTRRARAGGEARTAQVARIHSCEVLRKNDRTMLVSYDYLHTAQHMTYEYPTMYTMETTNILQGFGLCSPVISIIISLLT